MDPVTLAVLVNAALDLAAKLAAEYMSHPDADPAAIESINTKLDETVAMVKSKKPVPRPVDPGPSN